MDGPRTCVLVVDIDDQFLIAIERLLENQGFNTTTTWDPNEALERLSSQPFEVVLVGHHPPELHASDILQHIQRSGQSAACFVLQPAARIFSDLRFFLSQGARGVLCKRDHADIAEEVRKSVTSAADAAISAPPFWRAS
jgi:CheY-like chemotaxis protein